MFEVIVDTDDDFDTTDNDDGDDDEKRPVDEQEDTVEGVDHNGGNSATNEPTSLDTIWFFFVVFNTDLPTVVFLRGGLRFFVMVAMNAVVVIFN